jgi:hypothetical protein
VDESTPKTPVQIASHYGGDLARMLETLNGFKDKYGHWPTKLRLSSGVLELLREKHLTAIGFRDLESKLQLITCKDERLTAEDDAGLAFNYAKDGWYGKRPARGADEWLWQTKI